MDIVGSLKTSAKNRKKKKKKKKKNHILVLQDHFTK